MAFQGIAALSLGTNVLSNYYQLQSQLDQSDALEFKASRYKFKAQRSRMAAEAATNQTKLNNTILQEEFNQTQANQAVMFAMQGRSGATVANIISQDQENLNWDRQFMELSGIMESTSLELDAVGYEMDAAQATMAAARTKKGGFRGAGLGLLGGATSAAQIL